jgi:hypothetical protein
VPEDGERCMVHGSGRTEKMIKNGARGKRKDFLGLLDLLSLWS